ncbi:hypothetical protein D915_000565 [Fasciola hepatica]|uniref:SUEL-type lectin domain-containing protein n=1 Tax=Fasciola hepatica TaxID=6192 RepID=A0A4E0S3B6_FASHE|nr:hypothetical protein D915_000565 [Fasciola hepatica]
MEHLPHFALILLLLFTTRAMEPGITRTEMNLHGGNVDSVDELWSIFVRTSLVICQPDSAQFRCPPRMHIRPLITSVLTDPSQLPRSENVSPHCFRNDVSRWTKDPRQLNKLLHQCRLVDEHETVRHLCEGRNMCRVSVDSFFSNKSADCTQLNVPIKLEYKCLPDPNSASFEAICADTYMEVKCDSQVKGNTLVILTARLEKQIHVQLAREHPKHPKQGCPTLPVEHTSTACNTRIDVTQHFQSACDGRSSCSVSPSMADSKPEFTKMCGKMHLSLTYVCGKRNICVPFASN